MEERLQKIIAACGECSRRNAEKLITDNKVKVNGRIASLGDKADPSRDVIEVCGKVISGGQRFYIMLNKPRGYITTLEDERDRKTVSELVDVGTRVYPVGRLDYNSEGLLIMTNDGELTYRLTHPSNEITKTYVVKVESEVKESQLAVMRAGVVIDGVRLSKCKVKILEKLEKGTKLEVVISEGKNRQVRKMFDAVGLNVVFLKRTHIGALRLGGLTRGACRLLNSQEIAYLKSL